MDIRNHFLKEMIFPKRITTDTPGVIIYNVSSFYGLKQRKKRITYFFEENFAELHNDTIAKIGEKETSLLNYKIGKALTLSHLNFSHFKSSPPYFLRLFLIKKTIEAFSGAGINIADNVSFNENDNSFILYRKNDIVSKGVNDISIFCGMASAILSYFCHTNIETKAISNKKIIANKDIKEIYSPKSIKRINFKKYDSLNFPTSDIFSYFNSPSLKDFIKFKKIRHEKGMHWFGKYQIIPMEIFIPEFYVQYYKKNKLESLLKESLLKSSEKIAKEIFKENNIAANISKLKNTLCVLGWGKPIIKYDDNNIYCHFIFPPITDGSFLFQSTILNGYLNFIFNKKYELKLIKINELKNPELKIIYKTKA